MINLTNYSIRFFCPCSVINVSKYTLRYLKGQEKKKEETNTEKLLTTMTVNLQEMTLYDVKKQKDHSSIVT